MAVYAIHDTHSPQIFVPALTPIPAVNPDSDGFHWYANGVRHYARWRRSAHLAGLGDFYRVDGPDELEPGAEYAVAFATGPNPETGSPVALNRLYRISDRVPTGPVHGTAFWIDGMFCLERECAHLGDGQWTIVTADSAYLPQADTDPRDARIAELEADNERLRHALRNVRRETDGF